MATIPPTTRHAPSGTCRVNGRVDGKLAGSTVGLFDFLGGKKNLDEQAPRSAWQQALRQAETARHFAWRDDNEAARAFVRSLLTQAAPAFGNGKVVDGDPAPPGGSTAGVHINRFGGDQMSRSDRNVELHGTHDHIPLRIPISIPAKKIWSIELRFEDTGRYFTVLRDHTRIPVAADPNDPWAKKQRQCVFLGKGIFLDDALDFLQDSFISNWACVPVAAQELLMSEMERLDLRLVELSNTEKALFAIGNRTLHEVDDPIEYMRSCAAFLAQFAKLLPTSLTGSVSARIATRLTCNYCTSIFYLAPGKNTCPNCGAPATET